MLIPDDKTDFESSVAPSSDASGQTTTSSFRDPSPYPPEKELPPPYASGSRDASAAGPADPNSNLDVHPLQKSNYIEIERANSSIKGSWLIDTDLHVPPSLLAPLDKGKERPHLLLNSHNGSVHARVELCGDQSKERAILKMESRNGCLTSKLTNKQNQFIDLHCSSQNGGVYVYIHRGFRGPIKAISGTGSITFSSEVSRTLTTFVDKDGTRSCFLGTFEGSGYSGKEEKWTGDRLHAETRCGSVKVYFLEESSVRWKWGQKAFRHASFGDWGISFLWYRLPLPILQEQPLIKFLAMGPWHLQI